MTFEHAVRELNSLGYQVIYSDNFKTTGIYAIRKIGGHGLIEGYIDKDGNITPP